MLNTILGLLGTNANKPQEPPEGGGENNNLVTLAILGFLILGGLKLLKPKLEEAAQQRE